MVVAKGAAGGTTEGVTVVVVVCCTTKMPERVPLFACLAVLCLKETGATPNFRFLAGSTLILRDPN